MKNTTRISALLWLVLSLSACAMPTGEAASDEETKARRQAEVAERIKDGVENRRFLIDVRQMYPQSGPARTLTSSFTLEVKGDTLISYLPYYGRAYRLPYGGGKGLNFTATMSDYSVERGKGKWEVSLDVKNDEDTYRYQITVCDNAASTIDVIALNRESISFSGIIDK